jgi:hypothetical protein
LQNKAISLKLPKYGVVDKIKERIVVNWLSTAEEAEVLSTQRVRARLQVLPQLQLQVLLLRPELKMQGSLKLQATLVNPLGNMVAMVIPSLSLEDPPCKWFLQM